MKYLKIFLTSTLFFVLIDGIWLTQIAPQFYKTHIGHLLTDTPDFVAAAMFYIIALAGLMVFSILPALSKNSAKLALVYGGLYGLVTYATYDLTNQATLKNWPVIVTVVDLIWGTFLNLAVSILVYVVVKKFFSETKV